MFTSAPYVWVGGGGIINEHDDSSRKFIIPETLPLTSFALLVCPASWLISLSAATIHISHWVKNLPLGTSKADITIN